MSDDGIRYNVKDAKWTFFFRFLNNTMHALFYLALILLAYNCEWCGGPRF